MGDINPEAYNFRQVLIALLTAAVVASAGELLSGCSSARQPPPPSYAEVVAPAPTPTAPRITGAMILARQPKEVQDAIQHYREGAWPTYRNAHGMLVPYTERMDPITIDCAPNYHVDIYLLPGETATGVAAGDAERWMIGLSTDPTRIGQAVVYVKCKDINLHGDASIFTSAGRTYPLLLRSKSHSSLRWVRFYDPETTLAQMRAADAAPAETPAADPISPPPGTKVDVAYDIGGAQVAWRPVRTFDDGTHVWIEMPKMSSPVRPILLGDNGSQINYRVRGQYFETDSLFDKAALVADNQKVFIQRSAGNDLAVRCVLRIGDGLRTGYMHRMIMEAYHGPDLRHVKHLDGNLLNNQRFNLRWKGDKPRPPLEPLPIWLPRDSGSEVSGVTTG